MNGPAGNPEVRLAEPIASLSLAIDFGLGLPIEHAAWFGDDIALKADSFTADLVGIRGLNRKARPRQLAFRLPSLAHFGHSFSIRRTITGNLPLVDAS